MPRQQALLFSFRLLGQDFFVREYSFLELKHLWVCVAPVCPSTFSGVGFRWVHMLFNLEATSPSPPFTNLSLHGQDFLFKNAGLANPVDVCGLNVVL